MRTAGAAPLRISAALFPFYAKHLLFVCGCIGKGVQQIGILRTLHKRFGGKTAAPVGAEIISAAVAVTHRHKAAIRQVTAG